ncbi:MAG: hypothetical protein WBV72_02510 [Nitrososphaeraceae archaeon]
MSEQLAVLVHVAFVTTVYVLLINTDNSDRGPILLNKFIASSPKPHSEYQQLLDDFGG